MKLTTNLSLKKPELTDYVDVNNFNDNADILDVFLWGLKQDKVDKVAGKGLSTNDFTTLLKNKLDSVEVGATKYQHPASHPASMITESPTKRFASDTEKIKWNKTTTDLALTDAEVLANKNIVSSHLADIMPHQFKDGVKTYKWGFRTKNGVAQFIYEEVI